VSWTLKEQVRSTTHGIASLDWDELSDPALQRGAGDPGRAVDGAAIRRWASANARAADAAAVGNAWRSPWRALHDMP
jgi:hypothetical protein